MFDNYCEISNDAKQDSIEFEVISWFGLRDLISASKVECYFQDTFGKKYFQNVSKVIWLRNFDLIFVGPCSLFLDMMSEHNYLEASPFGKMPDLQTCIVQDILNSCQTSVKSVLLISRCCGKYSSYTLESLTRYYPTINWTNLDIEIHNFEHDADNSILIQNLIEQNIISLT
jgi:hypothetical protein